MILRSTEPNSFRMLFSIKNQHILWCFKPPAPMIGQKTHPLHEYWHNWLLLKIRLHVFSVQVNLFQKHLFLHKLTHNMTNCSAHVLRLQFSRQFHERSVILWVNWCKNKSFWQRFTCTCNINAPQLLLNFRIFLNFRARFHKTYLHTFFKTC